MYNKNSNYISIGEMAKINRTTVPTLKLYDSMGLLTPYYVDEHSHIATMISNRMQEFLHRLLQSDCPAVDYSLQTIDKKHHSVPASCL